jgi:hypothetical protein
MIQFTVERKAAFSLSVEFQSGTPQQLHNLALAFRRENPDLTMRKVKNAVGRSYIIGSSNQPAKKSDLHWRNGVAADLEELIGKLYPSRKAKAVKASSSTPVSNTPPKADPFAGEEEAMEDAAKLLEPKKDRVRYIATMAEKLTYHFSVIETSDNAAGVRVAQFSLPDQPFRQGDQINVPEVAGVSGRTNVLAVIYTFGKPGQVFVELRCSI